MAMLTRCDHPPQHFKASRCVNILKNNEGAGSTSLKTMRVLQYVKVTTHCQNHFQRMALWMLLFSTSSQKIGVSDRQEPTDGTSIQEQPEEERRWLMVVKRLSLGFLILGGKKLASHRSLKYTNQ